MRYSDAAMVRYIFQHKLRLQNPPFREEFARLLDLDEEELETLDRFRQQVADHVLEDRLVTA